MTIVNLHLLKTSKVKQNLPFVLEFVGQKRRDRALKFSLEKDQLLSLGAGYLIKKYLPNREILETKSGKPYLKNGPHFNISHSGECVVLAISNEREIGVDIELIDTNKVNAIKYVLNDKEKEEQDVNKLFQMWTNKESLVKCLSSGIKDLKKVNALPLQGIHKINNEEYFVKSWIYKEYSLSIALKGKEPFEIDKAEVNEINN